MKKFIVIAAIAALAFTACNKGNTEPTPEPLPEKITGTGTAADPYVLYRPEHIDEIATLATARTWENKRESYIKADSTCFKLGNDIDLKNAAREPIDLGMGKTGGKKLDFDGAGHTIKNFSITASDTEGIGFFSGLVGNVHDLKITGASITATSSKKIGIIAGVASSGDGIWTRIYNCSVQGTLTHTDGKYSDEGNLNGDLNLGGIVGQQCYGEIHECEADVNINITGADPATVKKYVTGWVGGIAGALAKNGLAVSNCISRGEFTFNGTNEVKNFGGIIGYGKNSGQTITNCISFVKINCTAIAGGIVGLLNQDTDGGSAGTEIKDKASVVKGCIAWNEGIHVLSADKTNSSKPSGAIVGLGGYCGYQDNYRKSNLDFTCQYTDEGTKDAWPLTKFNDNSTAGTAQADVPAEGIRIAPHNGKATDSGKTASQVATAAGWDTTIWDLTGDVPALKCLK